MAITESSEFKKFRSTLSDLLSPVNDTRTKAEVSKSLNRLATHQINTCNFMCKHRKLFYFPTSHVLISQL